jgi:DNA replication and repair protein RecF
VPIQTFQITHFRNVLNATIDCAPRFNLFYGDNGAGKTSILEAIYYLSLSKSFRTSHTDRLIYDNREDFVIFSQFLHGDVSIPIGIQRSRNTGSLIHINGEAVRSTSEVSRYLPIQFIGSDSHRILTDGPKVRRQFLDWGLFYTNPEFFTLWKKFQKTLNHRNAALKSRAPKDEIIVWNQQFVQLAESLHRMRQHYISLFLPFFNDIIATLLDSTHVQLQYSPGWDTSDQLLFCLEKNIFREIQIGHTLFGPHRADLIIACDKTSAQDVLSQGQQKLVSYALRLAQGLHFQFTTNESPIYLIDDLPSELDSQKRKLVISILNKIAAQVFITGIEQADFDEILAIDRQNRMFHVKHGVISAHSEENVSRETFCRI